MTANAFTSVSLDPLLVLVCVERESRFHQAISASDHWAVSILSRSAEPGARWLATKGRPLQGQLDSISHRRGAASGAALLDGALAVLECRTHGTFPGGDHDIIVGEVIDLEVESETPPLVYYQRAYRSLEHLD
jgi:flavin reductase